MPTAHKVILHLPLSDFIFITLEMHSFLIFQPFLQKFLHFVHRKILHKATSEQKTPPPPLLSFPQICIQWHLYFPAIMWHFSCASKAVCAKIQSYANTVASISHRASGQNPKATALLKKKHTQKCWNLASLNIRNQMRPRLLKQLLKRWRGSTVNVKLPDNEQFSFTSEWLRGKQEKKVSLETTNIFRVLRKSPHMTCFKLSLITA